jgi:hypothetical protein
MIENTRFHRQPRFGGESRARSQVRFVFLASLTLFWFTRQKSAPANYTRQMPDSYPKRKALGMPLLELLSDGAVHDDDEICESLVRRFGVDESKLPIIKKTGRPKFRNEIDWVKVRLGDKGKGKGWIRQVNDRHYQILPAGLAVLSE